MALTKIKTGSIADNAITDAKVADNITAGTAATLATARSINGVSFNCSSAITVTAAAGTLTGATLASGVTASSLTSVGTLTSLTSSGDIATSADKRLSVGTWDNSGFSGSAMYGLSITSSVPIVHLAESDETGKKAYFGMSGGNAYLGGNSITNLYFQTGSGTTALTIDSSQNATFAGRLNVGGAGVASIGDISMDIT